MRIYFPRLIGNGETKERLGRAIESGTLPHAFLIGGPSGSGKSTLAIEIAAALNCFPDVKVLAKKKDKATLGVEAVKDFREDMFLSSTESENKIYIIDDAESMTPEAQNSLLKVLEEPPKSVNIILLAKECDRILTTIKSRTQYIPMSRFDEGELAEQLLKDSAEQGYLPAKEALKAIEQSINAQIVIGVCDLFYYASNIIEERCEDMYSKEHQVSYHGIDRRQRKENQAKRHGMSW